MTPQELEQALPYYTGTMAYYKLYPQLTLTDGTQFLCDEAQCYWLMDIIWSYQSLPEIRKVPFQVYTLKVNLKRNTGLVLCEDSYGNELYRQFVPYTDFPLKSIKIYYIDHIALLPSEY